MKCRVRVKKGALNYFRKISRDSQPLEVQAYLIGRVVSPELVIIEDIRYPKEYAEQTTCTVRWWLRDYEAVNQEAEGRGMRIVGDIHSHPNWDAVLSPDDYRSHIESGFRVSGICSIQGRKTRVRFWIAESSLPCDIEYAER